MDLLWLSLLPPIIVVIAIVLTRRLNVSLIIGIFSAALIATDGQIKRAGALCIKKIYAHCSDADTIYLYLLLIVISSLINLLTTTGAAQGFARIVGKKMRTKRSIELSSIGLAFLLSIDDYLSILTVGFVIRPLADKVGVARTKLAYIMHSLASPLVILVPISTWAAAILVQLDNAGISTKPSGKIVADSFYVYLHTIPYVFYSLIAIASVLFIVQTRLRFGPIGRDEVKTFASMHGISNDAEYVRNSSASFMDLFLPIGLILSGLFIGIFYYGNYYMLGGTNTFFAALRENDQTFFVFFVATVVAFSSSVLLALYKKTFQLKQIFSVFYAGFCDIRSAIIMIVLASILGSFLRVELDTGNFLAHVLLGTVPLYAIPLMVFVVSLLITLATGSAWGTFSLLIPIVVQMLIGLTQLPTPIVLSQIPLLFPTLGALLSGAACGNHIAPFAETTIMTASSAGIEPLEHASTQLPYIVPVIGGAVIAFLMSGFVFDNDFLRSFGIPLLGGVIGWAMLFFGMKKNLK